MSVISLVAIIATTASFASPVSAVDHPRLLLSADDIPQLQARAGRDPWRRIKAVVEHSTSLVYRRDGNYYERLTSMRTIMRQSALAHILYPESRQVYVDHIVEQMRNWDDINRLRRLQPDRDWVSMITGGDAFFLSVIALDVIHDDLSREQRLAIGIKDELVRYSVGIEEEDELIADIDQALNKI